MERQACITYNMVKLWEEVAHRFSIVLIFCLIFSLYGNYVGLSWHWILHIFSIHRLANVNMKFIWADATHSTHILLDASHSLSKIAGVLNIARLDGSRRAMFFDCVKVKRYKIPISKRKNYKTNVILLFVSKKSIFEWAYRYIKWKHFAWN